MYCWPWQNITPLSIRVEQLNVQTDTKTKDNVTVSVVTAIQYQVDTSDLAVGDTDLRNSNLYKAVFLLSNAERAMTAFVDDVVRSELPTMTLDGAYEAKTEMADNVHKVMAT